MHFMVYRYVKGVPFVKERYKKKGYLFWQKGYIKGKGWGWTSGRFSPYNILLGTPLTCTLGITSTQTSTLYNNDEVNA